MKSTSHLTAWKDRLTTGDVVRFRFPVDDPDNPDAKAKRRPCLVMGVRWFGGQKFVEIAYGTGAQTSANRGFEIRVKGGRAKAQAGLRCYTRFIGTRAIIVSIEHPGFEPDPETGTPVMGRLDAKHMQRLVSVKATRRTYGDTAPSVIRAQHLRDQNRQRLQATRGFPERHRGSRVATP
ncbi:hypothetical protein RA2_04544 [Roseovarius sp. A-2]|uniref:hypothetical protein n=1 Tax=Roseovarius sp. A-2 TaxID=1570360 RepID=UPI0009B593CF|nr:hypothetical protein [Roseovarius sp. A-2]GAW37461.1 hypothetical protein RA2_04544 [Roseovarius sp. A-2]